MSKEDFFRVLSPIVSRIYDEHTAVDFSYRYGQIKKFIPIKVFFVNGTPFITENLLSNPEIKIGSELIAINGHNVRDVYKTIKTYYPNFSTDKSLEYDVYSLHFDYLYASFFEEPDSFLIRAIDPSTKKEYTVKTTCLLSSDSVHFVPLGKLASRYVNMDSCYQFTTRENTAIMKITSFAPARADFKSLFEKDFKTIKKQAIKHLVIDLRYNRGGDPKFGAMLLTYLYDKPFTLFDSLSGVLNKRPTYYKYVDTTGITFVNWNQTVEAISQIKTTEVNWYTSFRDSVFYPQKELFKGSVYLLVNSDIHSAAHVTSTLLTYYVKPVVIGTPISGPYNCGCALDYMPLKLPNSQLQVEIPIVYYRYNVPSNLYQYKQGITPNIIAKPSISDIIRKRDLVLDSTLSMIKATKGKSEFKNHK